MESAAANLAQALRERLAAIRDEQSRHNETKHVARLRAVSEKIEKLQEELPRPVDPRWSGGYPGRGAGRNFNAPRNAGINACSRRRDRDVLSRGCSARCATIRLRGRSVWPQEIILHYSRGLSHRNGAVRFFLELLELCIFSRGDGRGHRR